MKALREKLKAVLDRRYVRRDEIASLAAPPTTDAVAQEALRLARENASAIEQLLQVEVRLWQAIDAISTRTTGSPYDGARTPLDEASQDSTMASSSGDM